jgi:peptidoglycan hydrolase-like protein with peptidoglycan-binding domain
MLLRARRFRYDAKLQACLDGTDRLALPPGGVPSYVTGRFVRKIQRALMARGFPLPVHGDDSVYGPETAQAVSAFKLREKIFPADGVVGPGTMKRLDDLFADEPGPPIILGFGEMTVDDLLEAVQAAEGANAADTPEEFLTRLRQLYYPGTDPAGLTIREAAFDQLMLTSPVRQANGTRRILTPAGMDATMFARLSTRAFENAHPPQPPDNPGPYVVDDTATRVDLGHVLLTIDAVFHPVPGVPYTRFGIPSIDPASWVADVGTAAVWAEQNGDAGGADAPTKLPPSPTDNVDEYFRMSAPDSDLVGDIDGFNIANIWIGTGGNLSVPLAAYYIDGDTAPGGYRRRYRDFLANNVGDPDNPPSWRSMTALFETRINRFNDLFFIGAIGALTTLSPPPPKSWRRTHDVLELFFGFLERGVNTEKDTFD